MSHALPKTDYNPRGRGASNPRGHGGTDSRGRGSTKSHGRGGKNPNQDTRPVPTNVICNHFATTINNKAFYQIGLQYPDDIEEKQCYKSKLLELLSVQYKDALFLFDELCFFTTQNLTDEKYTITHDNVPIEIKITTTLVQGIQSLEQVYNIFMREMVLKMGYKKSGRGFYDPEKEVNISSNLPIRIFESWSIKFSMYNINNLPIWSLLINPSYRVTNSLTLYDQLQTQGKASLDYLKGEHIMTTYSNATYVFNAFDFNTNPMSTFKRNGLNIKYIDYYASKKLVIKDPGQPMIRATSRLGQVMLVPELCLSKTLSPVVKQKLPLIASIKPDDRFKRIQTFVNSLISKKELSNMLTINPDPLSIKNHHVLKHPNLLFSGCGERPSSASFRNLTDKVNWKSDKSLRYDHGRQKINVVVLCNQNVPKDAQTKAEYYSNTLLASISSLAPQLDVNYQTLKPVLCGGDFKTHLNKMELTSDQKAKTFFFAFLNGKNDKMYRAVLEYTLSRGYIKQGILWGSYESKQKLDGPSSASISNNLVRQILNKSSYISWEIPYQIHLDQFNKKHLMIVGVDIFHPGPPTGSLKLTALSKERSVAAFCCKVINNGNIKFISTIVDRRLRSELPQSNPSRYSQADADPDAFPNFISDCLKTQFESNVKPEDILVIIYRDGIDDEQMILLSETELRKVAQVTTPSQLLFIVVQKRIHTRFSLHDNNSTYYDNVQGGLVVNDLFRSPMQTFYLVPVETHLSTNSPVRYTILCKPPSMELKHIQDITWSLHHTYQNWPGPIKIPDVVQYAHILAYQCGTNRISPNHIHTNLRHNLYFL